MSGVEGYVESAASGLVAGHRRVLPGPGRGAADRFPEDTAHGALGRYIARSDPKHYQPTNIAFGLLPELPERVRDKAKKRLALAARALASLARFQDALAARVARRRRGRAASRARRRGVGPCTQARPGVPPPSRARAERLAAHTSAPTARTSRSSPPTSRASSATSRVPTDVDHLLIRGFLAELHRRGLQEELLGAQARGAAHLLPLALPRGRLEPNPARLLLTPRRERRIPAVLDEAQVERPARAARATASRRRAAARSSSCSTRPASAARSSWRSTSPSSTSTARTRRACSARAARSASCSSAGGRSEALRGWLARARRAAAARRTRSS